MVDITLIMSEVVFTAILMKTENQFFKSKSLVILICAMIAALNIIFKEAEIAKALHH